MGTEGNRYVKVQVSFGEVHEPKVSGVSANKQKICGSTVILYSCVCRKHLRSLSSSLDLFQPHMGQLNYWTSTVPVKKAQLRVHVLGSKILF